MATLAQPRVPARSEERFFFIMACVIAGTIAAGFSLHLAMGRSSFASPPLVHAHAVVFMGWVVIYLLQNVFAVRRLELGWPAQREAQQLVVRP